MASNGKRINCSVQFEERLTLFLLKRQVRSPVSLILRIFLENPMKGILGTLFSILFVGFLLVTGVVKAEGDFYAYYTKAQHSASDYLGKYADLIVVFGENKQLEFTRRTGYLPMWKTPKGFFPIDDFYPGRDQDYEFYYNYVRLVESTPERIKVHWRYYPDIETLDKANSNLDPLNMHGLLGVVHEIFTIYPDGSIEREIKEAKDTKINDWIHPGNSTKQTIQLTDNGVDHSPVVWGGAGPFYPREAITGNPVIDNQVEGDLLLHWSFDEGMEEHEDFVYETITGRESYIRGLMTTYKKGISGTALAFDGYYTGIEVQEDLPKLRDEFTISAWIALDAYPYNFAPIIHQSKAFGKEGFYFGIDPYGYAIMSVNGTTVKSRTKISLFEWSRITASIGDGTLDIFVNGKSEGSELIASNFTMPEIPLLVGINNEKQRCTDFVRTNDQNLLLLLGIQGLMDEIKVYGEKLSAETIRTSYSEPDPDIKKSDLTPGILPGENYPGEEFGAFYKKLSFHEVWDNLFRMTDYSDIVVKFEDMPTSVVYWHGTNYAANWITDENRWMSDQSSEIFTKHGCSEHMADKQIRHSYARIIENSPARVVIHWRYPCVDVSYYCANKRNWSDEYHTIYPDGTGVRKVIWSGNKREVPGFQDIQFFTNPGETALDVVNLQAMSVANINGDTQDLTWGKPNVIPEITIDDATIELLNSRSKYKIFVYFLGGRITPWGENEQSAYTDDPFAGPWNHWPVHLVPSDGRFAIDHDRVTHFALGANDYTPQFGSLVHYGFTDQGIESVIDGAKYWMNPPSLINFTGGENNGFDQNQKSYSILLESESIKFDIAASTDQPLVNPAFVLQEWNSSHDALVKINDKLVSSEIEYKEGTVRDENGILTKIIWFNLTSNDSVNIEISK